VKNTNLPDLTVFFCHKHLNAKKLSSHMWFFEGFCRLWHPKYCGFIDVGTKPEADGLAKYYRAMEADPGVGGVSGFLGLYFDKHENENPKIVEKQKVDPKKEEKGEE